MYTECLSNRRVSVYHSTARKVSSRWRVGKFKAAMEGIWEQQGSKSLKQV